MVADNKQPASENKRTESSARVGDGGQASVQSALMRVRSSKKTLLIIALAAILLVSWAIVGLHFGQKLYAQAAGHKIYKSDIDNLVGKTKGVSDRQAATVLADKYLTQAMAKQQGVTVTAAEITEAYGPAIQAQKKQNQYAYQLQVNQLYFDKLQEHNQGVYKGDLLVAHFSRNISLSPLNQEQKKLASNVGNPEAIAADKKYANDFITGLYNQIKAGKITWDQAMQLEKADPVVGEKMYPALSHSRSFDSSKAPVSLFLPTSARQQIRNIAPGQTSKPFVVSVKNSVDLNDKHPIESYFLVVKINSSSGGKSNVGFQQELTDAKRELRYKVYD